MEAKRLLLEKEAVRKRSEERKRKDKEREEESKKGLAKELETVKAALSQFESWISIADESVRKRNRDFKELLSKINATRKDLQIAQSNIEIGIKRRTELLTEETVLRKKLKELEKDN